MSILKRMVYSYSSPFIVFVAMHVNSTHSPLTEGLNLSGA